MPVQNLPRIPVSLPENAILKRLGYNRHLTEIPEAQAQKIRTWMTEALALCAFRGRAEILGISRRAADYVELEDGTRFQSARLAATLAPFARIAVFAVSAGREITEKINSLVAADNGAAALVYDATASESVDAAVDWLDRFLSRQNSVPATNNHRFSPGYFDWDISAQRDMVRILNLETLEITITPTMQLLPEKTVTAVKGI